MKFVVAAMFAMFLVGLVLAMIPSFRDFGLHWELFVKNLDMYIPGFGMMLVSGIALAWLSRR